MRKVALLLLGLSLFTVPAFGGGTTAPGVVQSGSVTAGHCAQFSAAGVVIDAGGTCGAGTAGVSQFSAGTTGLTPSTGTTGAVTLGGTLGVANGGTGVTSAQGNGTKVQLSTGTTTTNDCVKFDANGNTVDAGAACGSGSGSTPGGSTTQLQYNNAGAFGGITGATSNGTIVTLTSPTLVTPALGTPASGTLTNATGLPISTGVSGLGTGVATALGTNVGSAGAPVVNGGALGTPSSGTLTNATGLVPSTGLAATGTPSSSTCLLGNNTWGACATGGSVSVTSASSNIVINPTPGTGTFTVGATYLINAQTGTTYTVVSGDMGKLVTFSNTSAIAVTLPQAGTTGFTAGASFDVQNLNYGVVTITPTTSTVNGNSSLKLPRNTGCTLISDGTNWQIGSCSAVGRQDLAINFSGVPSNSQKFTFIADRPFNIPASLTNSQAAIGTNPTATLTVTLNKNGSSIGTVAFSTSGTPTFTAASATTFNAGDILTLVCPATADATGADIAITLWSSLNGN